MHFLLGVNFTVLKHSECFRRYLFLSILSTLKTGHHTFRNTARHVPTIQWTDPRVRMLLRPEWKKHSIIMRTKTKRTYNLNQSCGIYITLKSLRRELASNFNHPHVDVHNSKFTSLQKILGSISWKGRKSFKVLMV